MLLIATLYDPGNAATGHPVSSYQMVTCWSGGQLFRPRRYRVGAISRNGEVSMRRMVGASPGYGLERDLIETFVERSRCHLDPVSRSIDLTTAPEAEVDRATGRIIAEHRGGRAAIDVDAAIGVRVSEVGAGEAIRLRHRKSILQHHDVANAEGVARVGAADGNPNIAWAVPLACRAMSCLVMILGNT
jgi:hypothetical protein